MKDTKMLKAIWWLIEFIFYSVFYKSMLWLIHHL
nr:MAG TPA: hypothetical protein [Caudoviricetes sp.]DAS71949.1 MAG TPA: hypothetical protein [Caudoviricetes sp.]DAX50822.1 MAG TPA: hypothetical protein [Caudoviricetes sp.]